MSDTHFSHYIPELEVIWAALVRRDTLPQAADLIVIGGCRDLGLAEKAAELYHAGTSNAIITTGYMPSYMDITEARLLADHCIKLGVPSESIILENKSRNTGENIRLSAQLTGNAHSVILIHKPYMSLRFLATAEAQWPSPQPELYATCQDITFSDYCAVHSLEKVAYTMLGDMKRMSTYAEAGYQTSQSIPDEAHDALRKLTDAGFEIR